VYTLDDQDTHDMSAKRARKSRFNWATNPLSTNQFLQVRRMHSWTPLDAFEQK
jgi:hypothetical protein